MLLDEQHAKAFAREQRGAEQAADAGADDDGVVLGPWVPAQTLERPHGRLRP